MSSILPESKITYQMCEEPQTETESKSQSFVISNLEEKLKIMVHQIETLNETNETLISENIRLKMGNDEANMSVASLEISQLSSMDYEQELRTQNDTLQNIISDDKLEIDKIYAQLFNLKQETALLHRDYRNILNEKKRLSEQLKQSQDQLNKTKHSLEESYIRTIGNLQKENESLTYQYDNRNKSNTKLQQGFNALKHKLIENEECNALLNEGEKQYQIMLHEMTHEIETINEMLNDKNEEIEHLKERMILNSISNHTDNGLHQETHTEIEIERLRKEINDLNREIIELNEEEISDQNEIGMISTSTENTPLLRVSRESHHRELRKGVEQTRHRACGCCRERIWALWS